MKITFSSVKEEKTLEIRYIESIKLKTHVVNNHGYQIVRLSPEDKYYLKWARWKENKGNILMSEVFPLHPYSSLERGVRVDFGQWQLWHL
ncbi:MAG: hypothetical protein HZC11_04450 [Nitrospirae bacterium]|nr:hypothetical protein [Nitrospirota bacterium]